MTKLEELLKEKAKYEDSNENEHLQQKELKSIAGAILLELVDTAHLSPKEKEAFEWAKSKLGE